MLQDTSVNILLWNADKSCNSVILYSVIVLHSNMQWFIQFKS